MTLGSMLRALTSADVRFVVVGAVAEVANGATSGATCLDICYDPSPPSVERLAECLVGLRAGPRGIDDVARSLSIISSDIGMDARTIRAVGLLALRTTEGAINLYDRIAGVGTYDEVDQAAEVTEALGVSMRVLGLAQLIRARRAGWRREDRERVVELDALLALRGSPTDQTSLTTVLTVLRPTVNIATMTAEPDSLDVAELSSAAGVTPRTVRYYIQQGLLSSPGTRGPGARYDRGHLDRLNLIKRLQREHLPLAEIRRRLEELDDEGVREALRAFPESPKRSSAIDYVRQVLGSRQESVVELRSAAAARAMTSALAARAPAAAPPPPAAPASRQPIAAPMQGIDALSSQLVGSVDDADHPETTNDAHQAEMSPRAKAPMRSTWERIPLTADIELHVRRPLSREQNRMLDRLLELARQLFREES